MHDINQVTKSKTNIDTPTYASVHSYSEHERAKLLSTLRDFLLACYKEHQRRNSDKKNCNSEIDNEWLSGMNERFGEQLIKSIPVIMKPTNTHCLLWIISSLSPGNIAKMTLMCPRYQRRIDDLIEAMSTEPVSDSGIEWLLEELAGDAMEVFLYTQR